MLNLLDLESSLFSDDEDELRVLDRDEDEIEVATHSKVIQPYATFNSTYNHTEIGKIFFEGIKNK